MKNKLRKRSYYKRNIQMKHDDKILSKIRELFILSLLKQELKSIFKTFLN